MMKGMLTGRINSFNVDIQQLKVYKGDEIKEAESRMLEDSIKKFSDELNNFDLDKLFDKIPMLQGIPISPQSSTLKCMGLTPRNAMAEIEDRFIRIAYDFKVQQADKKCLFNIFESDEKKANRWEMEGGDALKSIGMNVFKSMKDQSR